MSEKYDNETCEACTAPEYPSDTRTCGGCCRHWENEQSDHDLPDHFVPSLECRKVRALERLAECCMKDAETGRFSLNIWPERQL